MTSDECRLDAAWRRPARIIGAGNPYRGDDGAGLAVVRGLRVHRLPGVTIVETSGEGTALMEAWRDAGRVVLVDAVRSQAPPGTIHRFDARHEALPAVAFRCSTHTFGVVEAIELARALDMLPAELTVYGIEGAQFETGAGLSAPVARAVERLIADLAVEAGADAP